MCKRLSTLPSPFDTLPLLQRLDLSGCVALQVLPVELGQLSALRALLLAGCSSLTALPDELGELLQLTTLNVEACVKLERMPDLSDIFGIDVVNLPGHLAAWETSGRKLFSHTTVRHLAACEYTA